MSSKWPLVKLGEHIDSSLGKMLDKNKNKGVEQPYLGNSNVRWGAFEIDDLAQMKFEEHEAERYGITEGDLIVCEGGEPGRCAIWLDERPNMKIQKALHRVRTKKTLHNYYLYYWFLFAGYKGTLEPYFTGTTIKHLTGKALKSLDIRLPPIAYQEWAVAKLKCLDDKIRANKSINQTLEKIAQAIFKSWFVDFEPTKAKIAAREALLAENPNATPEQTSTAEQQAAIQAIASAGDVIPTEQLRTIADLFPNQLVESDLGYIPSEWRTSTIGEHISVTKGKSYKSSELNPSKTALVTLKSFKRGGGYREDGLKEYTGNYKAAQVIESGELIMSLTDVTQAAEVIGKPAMVTKNEQFETLVASLDVAILRPKDQAFKEFFYGLMSTYRFHRYAESFASGTTVLHLNQKGIITFEFPLPSRELLEIYSGLIKQVYQLQEVNVVSNRYFNSLRNILLPELLKGKIGVED